MATRAELRGHSWDWLRVGAWSGSVAAHVAALLLVALPVTVPLLRPSEARIDVRWIETPPPPPAIPEPPPPTVPHRVRVPARTLPPVQPSTPVAHDVTPMDTPVADIPTASDSGDAATDAPTASDDIGSGGATQNLAYASPVQPRYPPGSVRAREEGTVLLRVLVDASGVPQRIEIERSSGHARLDSAAREAVSRARFRPVLRNGEAIPAWGVVPIAFRLDRA